MSKTTDLRSRYAWTIAAQIPLGIAYFGGVEWAVHVTHSLQLRLLYLFLPMLQVAIYLKLPPWPVSATGNADRWPLAFVGAVPAFAGLVAADPEMARTAPCNPGVLSLVIFCLFHAVIALWMGSSPCYEPDGATETAAAQDAPAPPGKESAKPRGITPADATALKEKIVALVNQRDVEHAKVDKGSKPKDVKHDEHEEIDARFDKLIAEL